MVEKRYSKKNEIGFQENKPNYSYIKQQNINGQFFDPEYYNYLKVYDYKEKIRIGNKFDGGYVISDISDYDCYISAGVGDDESFSDELIKKYNLKFDNCFSFDNTIEKKPKNYPIGMKHMSLNISDVNNTTETNLLDYFTNKNNVFLKMDIEGGELIWLRFIDKTILSKIKQMVIEFHDLDTKKNEVIKILEKINETHYLIHAHGNNHAHVKSLIPSVIELTFLRKTEFENDPVLNTNILPSSIDYPNNKNIVDIDLGYEPFVFKK
jgi:hypothetical protein